MTLTEIPRGVTATDLAATCGIPVRTVRRWIAAGKAPYAVIVAYRILRNGDLGAISPVWKGWHIIRDQLWSPENCPFRPGEIQAISITDQLVQELKRQLRTPSLIPLPFDPPS